jgi:hypothetical protein
MWVAGTRADETADGQAGSLDIARARYPHTVTETLLTSFGLR